MPDSDTGDADLRAVQTSVRPIRKGCLIRQVEERNMPEIKCPLCGFVDPVSIERILKEEKIYCDHCGSEISIRSISASEHQLTLPDFLKDNGNANNPEDSSIGNQRNHDKQISGLQIFSTFWAVMFVVWICVQCVIDLKLLNWLIAVIFFYGVIANILFCCFISALISLFGSNKPGNDK